MQNIYEEVGFLDKRCYEKFYLTEDILMEHAANGIADFICKNFEINSKIIIVCGSGNNGADGLACARLLYAEYKISIFYAKPPKSKMALLQKQRCDALNIPTSEKIQSCDVLIDAIVGTGFNGAFDEKTSTLIERMNSIQAYKIACDVPSGYKFIADTTLTMGGLKKAMFLDKSKEFVGNIEVINLGISRQLYELNSNYKLLEMIDLKLPFRDKKDTHKGSFGHLALALGKKSGAAILSALAAFRFGSGLVTLVGFKDEILPHSIMSSHEVPKNATALALGMGLEDEFSKVELDKFLDNTLALVVDADILHKEIMLTILKRENLVLTPHPKEFISLLKQTNLADIDVEELQKYRFKYAELFCKSYPNITLLLKGANVIIGQKTQFFLNTYGTSSLSKGGSGDILSGLIASLLAQGYPPLEATISASLTHTKLALSYKGANFSLTPEDLIDKICYL